ncbi:uncharacterized protein B0H18DRAFT_1041953 [Fomitopsis serialis]|uniref:uncharacterized protein n=1 Tax=Fomitopsis serialis TaxID=139415 RepID=UPI0020076E4F|nr:uncharacterized protein B0H18DRAFT_1041953 [Neoantrodia serialis]KAH9915314.1 hypothetical protein B0H18DRAFT_1041953 [Neoantrodia serialis]
MKRLVSKDVADRDANADRSAPHRLESNSTLGPPVMPPELTDRIVDFLHDDHAALKSCGLTCRPWLSAVRYHLYYAISLENTRLFRAFSSLLNRTPTLGQYVREIHLAMTEELQRSDALPSIVAHLGRVRRLALSGDILTVDQATFERFGPVQELALNLSSCKLSDVAALFLAFPGISDLSIKNTTYLYGPLDHVPMLPVTRLELQPALNPGLLPPSSPMLESLVLSIRRVEDLRTLSHILRTAIRQLKQLDLQIHITVAEHQAIFLDSLRRCPQSLTAIRLSTKSVQCLACILDNVDSTYMLDVALDVAVGSMYGLKTLSGVLARTRFRKASRIVVTLRCPRLLIYCPRDEEMTKALVEEALLEAYRRRVLSVLIY